MREAVEYGYVLYSVSFNITKSDYVILRLAITYSVGESNVYYERCHNENKDLYLKA